MNIKLILAGSGAALVPVVAVPTALGLSNNTSTEKAPELSGPERPPVPDHPSLPPSLELKDTPAPQLPTKSPLPPPPLSESRIQIRPPTPGTFPFLPTLGDMEALQDISDGSYHTAEADAQRSALRKKLQDISSPVKTKLSSFGSSFGYTQINSKTGDRAGQFKLFVEQTDQLREESKQEIKKLLDREEFKNRDFQTIFGQDLGFELLATHNKTDYGSFINLAIFRESEIEAQIEKDKPKKDAQPTKIGNNTTHEDILKFCKDPSEANSHLGMHSSSRTREEETKEYRFFTYYSYCQKGSFYLNKDLKLDPIPAPNI